MAKLIFKDEKIFITCDCGSIHTVTLDENKKMNLSTVKKEKETDEDEKDNGAGFFELLTGKTE